MKYLIPRLICGFFSGAILPSASAFADTSFTVYVQVSHREENSGAYQLLKNSAEDHCRDSKTPRIVSDIREGKADSLGNYNVEADFVCETL